MLTSEAMDGESEVSIRVSEGQDVRSERPATGASAAASRLGRIGAAPPQKIPSWSRAASVMRSGVHGGSITIRTSTAETSGWPLSTRFVSPIS